MPACLSIILGMLRFRSASNLIWIGMFSIEVRIGWLRPCCCSSWLLYPADGFGFGIASLWYGVGQGSPSLPFGLASSWLVSIESRPKFFTIFFGLDLVQLGFRKDWVCFASDPFPFQSGLVGFRSMCASDSLRYSLESISAS